MINAAVPANRRRQKQGCTHGPVMPLDRCRKERIVMPGCCIKIKESLGSLTRKEKQVAEYVLEFPGETAEMSIEELAAASGTSSSCVVRFCKSIGYSGYKEFCRYLTADVSEADRGSILYEDIRPGDSLESIARNVAMGNMKAIENSAQILDFSQLERAVDALSRAKRIDFYGVGSSGLVALDAHNKFMRINKDVNANADPHVQILSATSLKKGDAAVFISYTGETQDVLTILDVAKKAHPTTIAITRFGKNTLSESCDISLGISATETLIRSGAMSSRISQLTIVDILYTAVASKNYEAVKPYLDKTRFAAGKIRVNNK